MRINLEDTIIYPGDEQALPAAQISFECKRETILGGGDYRVDWKVFLDNSLPSFGEIDLGTLLQNARNGAGDRE